MFSRAGDVRRIIMGLDKHRMTPCGFAFVVYYTRDDAEDAVKYISGTVLDDRPVRADFDWGFKEGRQFGRGRSGGQARRSCTDAWARTAERVGRRLPSRWTGAPRPVVGSGVCHVLACTVQSARNMVCSGGLESSFRDVSCPSRVCSTRAAAHALTACGARSVASAGPHTSPPWSRSGAGSGAKRRWLQGKEARACGRAQVRDEYRTDWDAGRGGYGNIVKQELTARQAAVAEQMGLYAEGQGDEGSAMDAEGVGA